MLLEKLLWHPFGEQWEARPQQHKVLKHLPTCGYGYISYLGLTNVMIPLAPPPISRIVRYGAPKVTNTRKASQSSDVYSFRVVLLELLTRKLPIYTTGGDEVIHLMRWVHSLFRVEWIAEFFDVELMRYPNIEDGMVEMLQIAMGCDSNVGLKT